MLHELAHAATARAFRLPVHGITLVFWGGYTETHSSERGPLASFLISAAGPLTTLALGGAFWLGAVATDGVLSAILRSLAFLSILFAGLNALPGIPARWRADAAGGDLGDHEGPLPRAEGRGLGRSRRRRRARARRPVAPSQRERRLALLRVHRMDDDQPGVAGEQAGSHPSRPIRRTGLGGDEPPAATDPRREHVAARPREPSPRGPLDGVPRRGRTGARDRVPVLRHGGQDRTATIPPGGYGRP